MRVIIELGNCAQEAAVLVTTCKIVKLHVFKKTLPHSKILVPIIVSTDAVKKYRPLVHERLTN